MVFARHVGPLLTLVAPTGMTGEERKLWLHAAMTALSDLNVGQIEDGAREAMKTADHPSKIVPAIRKSLEGRYKPYPITIG